MNSTPPSNEITTLLKQAAILQQQDKLQDAFELYQRSLDLEPDNFDALHAIGVLCGQAGRLEEALKFFSAASTVQPTNSRVYFNLGKVLSMQGRLDDALASYDMALSLKPDFAEAHNNRGNLLKDLKRYEEAIASYGKAIACRPDYANAYNNLGAIQILTQRYDMAVASYDALLALRPDDWEAHNSRATAFKALGRHEEALAGYNKVIAFNAASADAHHKRAVELEALKRFDEALAAYDTSITLKPDFAESHSNRGNILRELRRYDEALIAYSRAIALKPGSAAIYNNQGNLLMEMGRRQEALVCFEKANALKPDMAEIYNNQGNLFLELGRHQEALICFEKSIALKPDSAEAHFNKSALLLLLGRYQEAWPLYEWRWKTGKKKDFARNFRQPLWLNDTPLEGRTILLHAEQGLGDTIQFARFIPLVEALGAKVIVEAPATLIPLLRTLKGAITLVESGSALPKFDCHCPLMSLPLAFRITIDTIPVQIPYLFADPRKQAVWRERLGQKNRPRVGLAWSGFTRHINDRHRSMVLRTLVSLLQLDYEFHSLHKEIRAEDRASLAELPQIHIHTDELHDFSDTAALVAELDMVISVDTSVAHLAGALGKPLWLLLAYAVDYRWLTERSDSPWYPTARLFRQERIGNWYTVIEKVKTELRNLL